MQELGKNNDLTLNWVPGHYGVEGNEKVDKLVKLAANSKMVGPKPFIGMSMNTIRLEKKIWLKNTFDNYWRTAPEMRHTKQIIKYPYRRFANTLIRMTKKQLRKYIMFLTGHGCFKAP